MSVWHGDLRKRKPSGGRKRPYRGKRKFESGSFPTETSLGEPKRKISRRRGGNVKIRLLSGNYANVTDPTTGRTERVEILTVLRNLSNADYDRRGVITKGAVLETPLGIVHVTSRPGQDGVLNAVLASEEEALA